MDKNIISDLDNFPEEDKQRMSTMADQLQIQDRYIDNYVIYLLI